MTVGIERVEAVDGSQDAGADGDLLALEILRIARAIPAFVMGADDGGYRVGEAGAFDDLGSDDGMDFQAVVFFRGEAAGLGDDVIRHGEFADVVENGGNAQGLEFVVAEAHFAADTHDIHHDAVQVVPGAHAAGFDGKSKGFDHAQLEGVQFLSMLFFPGEFFQLERKRAVDEEQEGHDDEDRFPPREPAQHKDDDGDGCTGQIVGHRPEVFLLPDSAERHLLRKGFRRGLGEGRDEEHGGGGQRQARDDAIVGAGDFRHAVVDGIAGLDTQKADGAQESEIPPIEGAAGVAQEGDDGGSDSKDGNLDKVEANKASQDKNEADGDNAFGGGESDSQPSTGD